MDTEEQKKLLEFCESFRKYFCDDVRSNLIDKSCTDDDLLNISLAEADFAKQYGFFMPENSLRKFFALKKQIAEGDRFVVKPLLIKTRIKHLLYTIYIRLQLRKLRKRVGQNR